MGNSMNNWALDIPQCEQLRQAYVACSDDKLKQSSDGSLSTIDKNTKWEGKCFSEFDVCIVGFLLVQG
jgi:hypothetical protein